MRSKPRTFEKITGSTKDRVADDLIMGHADDSNTNVFDNKPATCRFCPHWRPLFQSFKSSASHEALNKMKHCPLRPSPDDKPASCRFWMSPLGDRSRQKSSKVDHWSLQTVFLGSSRADSVPVVLMDDLVTGELFGASEICGSDTGRLEVTPEADADHITSLCCTSP